jgi:hypothetical protein
LTEVPAPSKSDNASGTAARNIESILRIEKEDEEDFCFIIASSMLSDVS